jgi:chemotaxis signal transduction protein
MFQKPGSSCLRSTKSSSVTWETIVKTVKTYPAGMPWLIVLLKGQSFALPTQEVRGLVMTPQTTLVPGTPEYVRGVMNIRGRMVPVIDLRKRLGMTPAPEEIERFCAMMDQRRQDHVNWLNELEASARERREFKLATDPHKCAFGRWYDNYKPENVWIRSLLRRFAEPHQRIHSTASEVLELQARENWEGAMGLIGRTRSGVLAKMIALFDNLQKLIRESQQEIAVVLQTDNRTFAVSVDEAVAVERFERENLGPLPVTIDNGVIAQFGSRGKTEPLVLMVATERLLEKDTPVPNA